MILYLIYGFGMVTCTVYPLSRCTAHLLPVYRATYKWTSGGFLSTTWRATSCLTDTLWNKVEGVMDYDVYSTLNNISVISWQSVLLVRENKVPAENHRPLTRHWQTLSHNVVSSTPHHEWDTIRSRRPQIKSYLLTSGNC